MVVVVVPTATDAQGSPADLAVAVPGIQARVVPELLVKVMEAVIPREWAILTAPAVVVELAQLAARVWLLETVVPG